MSHSSSPADYAHLFELAPVSLWLEDFSALKRLFDRWRAEGVSDLRAHVAAHPECLAECAASLQVLEVNQRTLELFGASSQAELLANLSQVFRGDMLDHFAQQMYPMWEGELGFAIQTVNYALDGRRLDVKVQARVLQGHEATWERVMVSLQDITHELQTSNLLVSSEQHARDLFDYSPVSLWVEDFSAVKRLIDEVRMRGIEDFRTFINVHPEFVSRCMQEIRVIDVNRQTLTMFGAKNKAELLARLGEVFQGEMRDSFAEQLIELWQGKTTLMREVVNYRLGGDLINIHMQFAVLPDHLADWDLVLVSLVDITARKKAEAYLEYLGKHDSLTQLRNRAFYMDELNRLSRKGPWPLSVLIMDLNGLKQINDEHGHVAGDALLRRAGEVFGKVSSAPMCAARTGGDEFAMLLPGSDEHGAQTIIDRIHSILELNNQFYTSHKLSIAIGMATCHSSDQLEAALIRADRAMYVEKTRYYQEQNIERRTHGG
ncbi:diguanylate cyclase (GGDEF) domain-containing protein [Rhodoferax sp. OV413]|uniref:sensor domain-containing diguanylate cyclase n=1 Tax=Rhodoferax sp. OV413 TaxID=1855285 RepID=UPI00087FBD75|nr:sensor domain-containing diguanylate cyclase [Rhodoferax sp. OV413]SDO25118.1 diguanylate cyclase (GGDEF) domain-containing protein [Rhodoferax sp. OV413]